MHAASVPQMDSMEKPQPKDLIATTAAVGNNNNTGLSSEFFRDAILRYQKQKAHVGNLASNPPNQLEAKKRPAEGPVLPLERPVKRKIRNNRNRRSAATVSSSSDTASSTSSAEPGTHIMAPGSSQEGTNEGSELAKKRLASRLSSRRTREREKLRMDHFRNAKLKLEQENKRLDGENQQLRKLIETTKQSKADLVVKAGVVQTLLQQQQNAPSNLPTVPTANVVATKPVVPAPAPAPAPVVSANNPAALTLQQLQLLQLLVATNPNLLNLLSNPLVLTALLLSGATASLAPAAAPATTIGGTALLSVPGAASITPSNGFTGAASAGSGSGLPAGVVTALIAALAAAGQGSSGPGSKPANHDK